MIPALVLPDGRRVELDDDIVLGRAPVAPESSPVARSISLAVPTVSKTHALIGLDESGVWPKRQPATAPTPPQDVFYAPGQSPEPPFSGPGAPPFS